MTQEQATGLALSPDPAAGNLAVLGVAIEGEDSTVLLGPGSGFWSAFTGSDEYSDGAPDPLDRCQNV